MTALPPLITSADATQRLQSDGLPALGLTAPLLGPIWSNGAVTYNDPMDADPLTLSTTNGVFAPFVAIHSRVDDLRDAGVYGLFGLPLIGRGSVVRLHPQAARRLEQLAAAHLGPVAGVVRPVPHTMVIRGMTPPDAIPEWVTTTDILVPMNTSAVLSFHDERGLIVDPIAVAALFTALATAFPALAPTPLSSASGGVANIAGMAAIPGMATVVMVHVVDPHGAPFRAIDELAPVVVDGSGQPTGVSPPPNGLLTLSSGQGVAPPGGDAGAARIRVGWARNATLDRVALYPPALPAGVTLSSQFLRVCAVDLDWHLLGNRSVSKVHGVGPADQTMPAEFRPQVRDRVRLDYLVDGVDVLAASGQALGMITAVQNWPGLAFAASPTLDTAVGVPPAPGPAGHWPQFPTPAPGGGGPAPTVQPNTGLTTTWSGQRDVVLTFPSNTLAVDWHVRVYPQVFQTISSIGPEPSFLRGDGVAMVVTATGTPLSMLLANPLRLPDGSNQPANSVLIFDLVVTDRAGNTRMFGNQAVPIVGGTAPAVIDQFAAPDLLGQVTGVVMQSIAPSPVFGIPRTAPAPMLPPNPTVWDFVQLLAQETPPRVGPRVPTMARFPTLVAVGTGATNALMAWDAVVSGGRWSREIRSAHHTLANPGNPAGPDVHAPGVRVDGAAAFDVAQIALRRAQPLLPLSDQGGWVPIVANAGWDAPLEPATDAAPPGGRTCAAAVLRTTAVGCESPLLALIPDIPPSDASVQDLVDAIADELKVTPPIVNINREYEIVREIRREFFWNRFGSRDAQWALRRAVRHARDLVLVVSPQFCQTSYPPGDPSAQPAVHEVDLVAELATRMAEQPSLRVLVCVPRWPDPDPRYGGWVRQAFHARNAALDVLRDVDPGRVVAFHPNGFPGRAAVVRSTVVIVDDVWALVGTSHWRRRGMTFDEGVDVVGFDRALDEVGASRRIRVFRQALLAALTGVRPPAVSPTDPDWVRLAGLRSCVDLAADLVGQGGLGRLAPFWGGPTDTDVLAQSNHVADPDGGTSANYVTHFAQFIGESPIP